MIITVQKIQPDHFSTVLEWPKMDNLRRIGGTDGSEGDKEDEELFDQGWNQSNNNKHSATFNDWEQQEERPLNDE